MRHLHPHVKVHKSVDCLSHHGPQRLRPAVNRANPIAFAVRAGSRALSTNGPSAAWLS